MILKRILLFVFVLIVSYGSVCSAESSDVSSLMIRGFGTLGLAKSSDENAEYRRDFSQTNGIKSGEWSGRLDNILGVQANWLAMSELEIVGQLVSRFRYDDSYDPELEWAYAKWDPNNQLSLRAGRIGSDFMMLADSRLVGYSYLPVRPSADFFGILFFSEFEGVDASFTTPMGEGLIRSKLFAGNIDGKASGSRGVWDTGGSSVYGMVIDYFTGSWQFRASSTNIRFASNVNLTELADALYATATSTGITEASVAADMLMTDRTTSRFHSLGIVYDRGPLQVQAAVNNITHETAIFQNSHGGYLLTGYRLEQVTPYVGVSWWKSRYKDYTTGLPEAAPFTPLNQAYQDVMVNSGADQVTYTLGARWDVFTNVALKIQWDAVRGNLRSKFPFANNTPDWDGQTDVMSVSMDFIF